MSLVRVTVYSMDHGIRARTLLWLKPKAGAGIQGLGLFYG